MFGMQAAVPMPAPPLVEEPTAAVDAPEADPPQKRRTNPAFVVVAALYSLMM